MTVAATVGQNLTTTTGTWTNSPTSFSYQWNHADGGPIAGASGSSYTPVNADIGHPLSVTIIASNGSASFSAPATSLPTSPVVGSSGGGGPPSVGLNIGIEETVDTIPVGA